MGRNQPVGSSGFPSRVPGFKTNGWVFKVRGNLQTSEPQREMERQADLPVCSSPGSEVQPQHFHVPDGKATAGFHLQHKETQARAPTPSCPVSPWAGSDAHPRAFWHAYSLKTQLTRLTMLPFSAAAQHFALRSHRACYAWSNHSRPHLPDMS
jgi:hypothetical protein